MPKMKANPVFEAYENRQSENLDAYDVADSKATYVGVAIKTAILIGIALISGIVSSILLRTVPMALYIMLAVGCVTSFVSVMIGTRNPNASMVCGIIYSIGEGLSLGMLATICGLIQGYEWIVPTAIAALAVVFVTMLVLYATNVVRAGKKIQTFIITVLISYLVLSLIGGIMFLFGSSFIYEMLNFGPIAIAIALVLVLVGAFSLLIDFQTTTQIVENGCEKNFEWTAALGLMVSIVYLFVQIVRLLLIIADSRNN